MIRDDKEGQKDNHIYPWEAGNKEATDRAFAEADVVVSLDTFYPRSIPRPLETCGCIADVNPATGQATIYMTSQAPHAIRTVFALVAGLPEENIRIISPDLGGGFGNKVPVYPGYVVATAARCCSDNPVKWIEDRTENLISTGFARDFHMHGELALKSDGTMLGLRASLLADEGAFYADAQPTKFKVGLFHIVTGSYDLPAAHVAADGYYTNKAPGGVAYRCSFRVTEASYLIERLVQNAAYELGMDPADLRKKNFIEPDQFPYKSVDGVRLRLRRLPRRHGPGAREDRLRRACARNRSANAPTASCGASGSPRSPRSSAPVRAKDYDIIGLKMNDGAELRIHPTGKAILKISSKTQGQGHETTFAQIVAEELGIQPEDIKVMHGDTDNTPYGLGTYASRSTPVSGAATAMVARRVGEKARKLAAHLLEVAEEDIEFDRPQLHGPGAPDRAVTIQDVAFAAYTNFPEGMEAGLEGIYYYDPPNLTFPFGTYVVSVEVDPDTGVWKVKRMVAVDDCGVRINPMIVEGQIHGGLTEGYAHRGDAADHVRRGRQLHRHELHGLPDPDRGRDAEVRAGRDRHAVAPPPDRREGRRRVGHGRLPAAYVNAVIDALQPLGVKNIDMPVTSAKVWEAIQEAQGRS